jgi:riboflavin kinase/FMN adenylyltransferase
MHLFRELNEIPPDWQSNIISIGNFDGVHCGHQHVLANVVGRARASGARSMAVTFDPHPLRVLRPDNAPRLITPLPQKIALLAQSGVDAVVVLPFDAQFASTSPRVFAREIVAKRLRAKEVHEGANFHFGHRAEGNCEMLSEFGREFGFNVVVYPEMRLRGETVSSSRIRELLLAGHVRAARRLLGRTFSVIGSPAPGRGYGSKYTVPTINLAPYAELVPANGVYVTCTQVAGEIFESVTNVGNRPTFGESSFAVESHLFNFHPIVLNESTQVQISFLKWLRPEVKWPTPEALKEQIGKDVGKAKRFFRLLETSIEA